MKKLLNIVGLVFTLLLSTLFVSCGSDIVVPKYEEDEKNPDKPVGGEEPKWIRNSEIYMGGFYSYLVYGQPSHSCLR